MRLAYNLPAGHSTSQLDDLSPEVRFLRESERFRWLAERSWGRRTIHPRSEFVAGKPNGHCGVTNFGFGIWLDLKGIVVVEDLSYIEGRIVRPDNETVGDDHTFLQAKVSDGCQRNDLTIRADLTGDQFPGVDVPVAIQYEDYFYPDELTHSGSRVYVADEITPLASYDVTRFNGRLGHFMFNVCNAADQRELPTNYVRKLVQWGLVT
jgi:hypothetical protein